MKITVSYVVREEREIEVDDSLYKLTSDGGWCELSYTEQDRLTNELLEVASRQLGISQNDIEWIEGNEEPLFEG